MSIVVVVIVKFPFGRVPHEVSPLLRSRYCSPPDGEKREPRHQLDGIGAMTTVSAIAVAAAVLVAQLQEVVVAGVELGVQGEDKKQMGGWGPWRPQPWGDDRMRQGRARGEGRGRPPPTVVGDWESWGGEGGRVAWPALIAYPAWPAWDGGGDAGSMMH